MRYFLYGAGLEERLALMRDVQNGRALDPEARVRDRVQEKLHARERAYGMRNELSSHDVLKSTMEFRQALAAMAKP